MEESRRRRRNQEGEIKKKKEESRMRKRNQEGEGGIKKEKEELRRRDQEGEINKEKEGSRRMRDREYLFLKINTMHSIRFIFTPSYNLIQIYFYHYIMHSKR